MLLYFSTRFAKILLYPVENRKNQGACSLTFYVQPLIIFEP